MNAEYEAGQAARTVFKSGYDPDRNLTLTQPTSFVGVCTNNCANSSRAVLSVLLRR